MTNRRKRAKKRSRHNQKSSNKALRKANNRRKQRKTANQQQLEKRKHNSNLRVKVRRRKRGGPYPRYINFHKRLTFLISRRCLGRAFRLPPNDPTRKLFEYFLAYAAKRYRIAINAVVIMSNHYHLVVSATRWNSNISGFMRCLNHNTSKVLNRRQGKRGPLYEVEPFDIRPLATEEDILRAMTYVTHNPIKAGLVEQPQDWPGLVSTFEDYGHPREIVERPEFFGPSSDKPTELQLQLAPPPAFYKLSIQEFQRLFQERCENDLQQIHDQRSRDGLSYLGIEALQNQSIDDTPNSPDIDKFQTAREERATSHNSIIPLSEAEKDYKACQDAFQKRHQECLESVKAGERPTFPYPTIKMVQVYGFPMEPRTSKASTPILHHFPDYSRE